MTGGLFIALYDEESLKLYLDKGVYGFLMNPVFLQRNPLHEVAIITYLQTMHVVVKELMCSFS